MSNEPFVLQYTSADAGQPPGSRIRAEHGVDGVTFVVPPEVTAGTIAGLVGLSLFILLILISAIAMVLEEGFHPGILVMLFMITAPVGLLAFGSIRTMTRATFIAVADGQLSLRHAASLFGRRRSWPAARIERMQVPFRGFSARGRTNGDLQVKPKGSMAVNLLTGRDRAEMRWMAHEISLALHRADAAAAPIPVVAINEPQTVQDSTSEPPSPDNSLI